MAIALAQLQERGLLNLEDCISQHIPEFSKIHKHKDQVTILQVLLHIAGFPYAGMSLGHNSKQATILQACIDADLDWQPGSRCCYHLHGWTVLAEIVHRVDGRNYA